MDKGIEFEFAMDNICKIDDTIWFVENRKNVLFKREKDKNYCEMVMQLPGECILEDGNSVQFRNTPMCFAVDGAIFCLPNRGKSILIVNPQNNQVQAISIDNPNNQRLYMCNLWLINNEIWLYASGLGKIYCIDRKEKTIRGEYSVFDEGEAGRGAELVGDNIYTISQELNVICEFNVITKENRYFKIKDVEEGFFTICYKEDLFWLSGVSGNIYIWNKNVEKIIDKIIIDKTLFKSKGAVFLDNIVIGDKVCFIPRASSASFCSKILCVDSVTKGVCAYEFLADGQTQIGNCYILDVINEEELVCCSDHESTFNCRLNVNTGKVINEKYKVDKVSFLKFSAIEKTGTFYECNGITPVEILDFAKKRTLQEYGYGSRIYNWLIYCNEKK